MTFPARGLTSASTQNSNDLDDFANTVWTALARDRSRNRRPDRVRKMRERSRTFMGTGWREREVRTFEKVTKEGPWVP